MGFNTLQRKRRDAVMNGTVADFQSWQLGVACQKCGKQRVVPIVEFRAQFWGEVRIARLIGRLQCSTAGCANPPSRVVVVNPRGQEIVLVGQGFMGDLIG
jgi:hypothetical protein